MAKVIPVLGKAGFVTDLAIKADEALSNFYLTQQSQSDSFRGGLVSLAALLQKYGNNERILVEETTNLLQPYFDRQFDACNLKVVATLTGPNINLQIDAILRDGNDEITLVHAVTYTNSKIQSIIDLQNTGREIIPADLLG